MSKSVIHPFAGEMQTTPPTSINPANRSKNSESHLKHLLSDRKVKLTK